MIVVLKKDSAEFGVTVAAIPIVLVLLILCGIAVQREIKWQVGFFMSAFPHLTMVKVNVNFSRNDVGFVELL